MKALLLHGLRLVANFAMLESPVLFPKLRTGWTPISRMMAATLFIFRFFTMKSPPKTNSSSSANW